MEDFLNFLDCHFARSDDVIPIRKREPISIVW
jgi:hypothetical protein